ncbi:MAG: hypothetical protein HOV68_27215 [Streptomycetaceae bacterium]|nr:hypothetical protein [Streptomycetaceae bacterium]
MKSGELPSLRSIITRHRGIAALAVGLAVCLGLLTWTLAPTGYLDGLRRAAAQETGPPRDAQPPLPPAVPAPQVEAAPGELCSTEVNRHPAAEVDGGRFVVNPNEWNAVGGLCIRTDGGADFRVTQSGVSARTLVDPDRGPGAYAHITTPQAGGLLPIRVDRLRYATSSWRTETPDAGTYNASYDLWFSSVPGTCSFTESAELMIWIDSRNKRPSGTPSRTPAQIGGSSYAVYELPKSGSHTIIVYQMAEPTDAVANLDLRAFTLDAMARGYVPGESELCSVQAGFEVWDGGVGLRTDSFSFDAAAGFPTGAVTSGVPGKCLAVPEGARSPVVGTCDGTPAQEWSRTAADTFVHAGTCLEAGRGGSVFLAPCTESPAQRWRPGASDALVNQASGQCLDAADPAGPRVHMCDRGAAQTWYPPV